MAPDRQLANRTRQWLRAATRVPQTQWHDTDIAMVGRGTAGWRLTVIEAKPVPESALGAVIVTVRLVADENDEFS